MKNKFLEFLLNDKLKDITYYIREISSERDKRYSEQEEDYPYLDDFFKFFEQLNVSQEELFDSIRREKASYSLADMLIGAETQNDKNREEKFDKFKPLIENNINFYKQVMKVFLSNHGYIKEQFQEKNNILFEKLIDIGVKKGFFQYFSTTELQTQKPEYKKILIEKEVFSTDYKLEDTIKILNNKNGEVISNHFSMYSESIHNELEKLDAEKFQRLKESLITILKIEEEKQESEVKSKFNSILYHLMEAEKERFLPLIKNPLIIDSIVFTEKYSNNAIQELIKHPNLLEELLNNIEEQHKPFLFKKERYISSSLISLITENSRNNLYVDEGLLNLLLDNVDKNIPNEEENNKEILMTNILFNQALKLNNSNAINKVFEKYTKQIIKALSSENKNENYFKYDARLIKFAELEKLLDSNLYRKIKSKIEISHKDKLYKLSQNIKANNGSISYQEKETLESLVKYLNITKDISVLNVLNADTENPEWKNVTLSYNIDKKYFEKENILVYLLRKVEKAEVRLSIIEWVLDESINNFYDLRFSNKDVLSYYQKENDNSKNKNGIFINIVDKILENEVLFDTLLKNNKVKMKQVQAIDNEEIKKKLNYHLLRDKLGKNEYEPSVKIKKNKI